jgi:hypothetical protein
LSDLVSHRIPNPFCWFSNAGKASNDLILQTFIF